MVEGRRETLPSLAFNLGVVSGVVALVDLSMCSFLLVCNEDFNKQTFRREVPVYSSILCEAMCLLLICEGLVGCIQAAMCVLLSYRSVRTSEDLRWFCVWATVFTATVVLYLRASFAATLYQEPVPIVHVLAKGVLSSVLNVYFMIVSLCLYQQHTSQWTPPVEVIVF